MVEESQSGTFLARWLRESTERKQTLAEWSTTLSADDREAEATAQGFRTWRALIACFTHEHHALELFAKSDVFAAIWRAMRKRDPKGETLPWGFSPAIAGAPAKILQGIETWHKTPKFTVAESARHHERIATAARDLAELLEQVTPGGYSQCFHRFELIDDEGNRALSAFQTPTKQRDIYKFGRFSSALNWTARTYLERAGVTPLWSLRRIESAARNHRADAVLPRKVRAKAAFRTYMIGEVAWALAGAGPRHPLPVGDQLIADAVALLVNEDCSIDDVRKALVNWRTEDLEAKFKETIHREN